MLLRRRIHSLSVLISESQATTAAKRPMLTQCGWGESGEREGLSLGAARHGRSSSLQQPSDAATSAAVRACRNALGFNTSPAGRIDHYLRFYTGELGGVKERMIIQIKLGVPEGYHIDEEAIRAEFPYGRLLPLEIVCGGLTYRCGAVSEDEAHVRVVVNAAVAIGVHASHRLARPSCPSAFNSAVWLPPTWAQDTTITSTSLMRGRLTIATTYFTIPERIFTVRFQRSISTWHAWRICSFADLEYTAVVPTVPYTISEVESRG